MRSGEREKGGESYVMINVEKLYHSQGTMETRTRRRAMGECNWCGKVVGGKTASPGRRTPQRPEPDIGDGKRGVKSVRKLSHTTGQGLSSGKSPPVLVREG